MLDLPHAEEAETSPENIFDSLTGALARFLSKLQEHRFELVFNGDCDRSHDLSLKVKKAQHSTVLTLVQEADGTVEIVDFKSEKKPDLHLERERVDRYRRQLEVYGHIIQERMGVAVSKLHLYYTGEKEGSPYVSFPMDQVSVIRTVDGFDGVVERIERRDFGIVERPVKLCENCDMNAYCDRKG